MPLSPQHLLFTAYSLLGPTAWFLYALGLHTGLRRLSLLDQIPPFPTDEETVLAIIPAHNEEQTLHTSLTSVLAQKGCQLQVLTINDRSTDKTPTIIQALQQSHPNLHTITLTTPPPPTQTGKCSALIRGLKAYHDQPQPPPIGAASAAAPSPQPSSPHTENTPAPGTGTLSALALSTGTASPKWYLFLDADTTLHAGAIASALRLALKGKQAERKAGHDLVSLLPRQLCTTTAEKASVPLFAAAIIALWSVPYANSDRFKNHAFACGQFLLIRSDLYYELGRGAGGHTKVATHHAEDVELARLAKQYGAHPRVATAPQYATVHQRPDPNGGTKNLIHQWARNLYGMRPYRPLPLLLGLAFPFLTILPLALAIPWTLYRISKLPTSLTPLHFAEVAAWLTAVMTHTIFLFYSLTATYKAQNLPRKTLLLFPYGLLLYLQTLLQSLSFCFTKSIPWRPISNRKSPIANRKSSP